MMKYLNTQDLSTSAEALTGGNKVAPTSIFGELGLDSLDEVEFMMELEEILQDRYGISVDLDIFMRHCNARRQTIEQLCDKLNEYIQQTQAA